jgi:transcriptional regulator with XRE-family HTH domain
MKGDETLKTEGLAKELRILRAKAGITQDELAARSGVAKCTIVYIENSSNETKPRVETLLKLAKALEVDENILLQYID